MGLEEWQTDGILAWIPTELATTPEAASLVLSDKIESAVLATLKESKRKHGDVRKGEGYNNWLGKYVFQTNESRYLVVKFADKDAGCELPKMDIMILQARIVRPAAFTPASTTQKNCSHS